MKILLTGKTGQLGAELQRALVPLGEVVAPGRAELDLARPDVLIRAVRELKPAIIVNAAAYTTVDAAESETAAAMAVNSMAPLVLADEAKRLGALLVHYSTDYVFDGEKTGPYTETDAANPLNMYGLSKLAGEAAIEAVGGDYLILRTSWVYSARGRNFMLTMLRLAAERDELKVVDDQIGAPTSARAIADATARVLPQIFPPHRGEGQGGGIFHLTAVGSTSWYGFASAILKATESRRASTPRLTPIASSDYPSAARRPKNSMLSNEKFINAFGFSLAPWDEELRTVLSGDLPR